MAEITQPLTPYTGVVPNPATQTQAQLDAAATSWASWLVTAGNQYPTWGDQVNAVGVEAVASANISTLAKNQAEDYAASAQVDAQAATSARAAAQVAQAGAEAAETAAQGYASLAQATNPDTPIRVNPNAITADFTLPAGYNGLSAGPIEITDDAIVTVTPGSTWTIA
ncbi:MAG: hypothetical protein VBE63_15385 [Lamprobacter sp.]|uniref:hypothetical protein n=1 Tax=Lamprobacter sp. TaxID=3100796 RepID=UPI002B263152|nr:hypothetical protein [Lamprobacter sp.]MEA3641307.1 hypothetical protein [Lamprobacter sp.]